MLTIHTLRWEHLIKSTDSIINGVKALSVNSPGKLNGAIILIHAGTDARRRDKLYNRLDEMIDVLRSKGFTFKRVDELLSK